MATVTITIDTSNAAFEDNPGELRGILEVLAAQLYDYSRDDMEVLPIRDSNGNTVGRVVLTS